MLHLLQFYPLTSTIRARKKGYIIMNISKTRSLLYGLAKILGDVSAVQNGKVAQRIVRRQEGKYSSRAITSINKKFGGK